MLGQKIMGKVFGAKLVFLFIYFLLYQNKIWTDTLEKNPNVIDIH